MGRTPKDKEAIQLNQKLTPLADALDRQRINRLAHDVLRVTLLLKMSKMPSGLKMLNIWRGVLNRNLWNFQ